MKENMLIENLATLAKETRRLREVAETLARVLPDPESQEVNGDRPRSLGTARLGALELAVDHLRLADGELAYAGQVTPEDLEREHRALVTSSLLP